MKKKLIVITFAILFSFSVYAMMPTISSAGETTVRIGVIVPTDDQLVTIIPLFEEIIEPDINAYVAKLPSLRFKPDLRFEFLLDCASGSAETHLEKVQNFARMGIDIIIGGFWSVQADYALPYMNEHNMLLISPASTDPSLAIPNDCLFRLPPDENKQGSAIAEMIISKGITNIVVIQRNDQYGNWIYDAFCTEYDYKGGIILDRIQYPLGIGDYAEHLQKAENVVQNKENVGILLISLKEASDIIQQAEDYTNIYNLPWFGAQETALNDVILEFASIQACHLKLYSTSFAPDHFGKYSEMASRYEELTGESLHIFRTTLIDAAWIIVQAVLETRPTAPVSFSATDVIEVLPDVASRYYGYSGWCALNEAGDRSLANYDIWGYGLDETEEPSFINYGFYNSITDEVIWHEIDEFPSP